MQQRWQVGYLFTRHNGWFVRYYSTKIVDGQPKRVQCCKRLCDGDVPKKTVEQLRYEHMASVNEVTQPQADLTIVDFWDKTYEPFIEENLKPSTVRGYKQVWAAHLKKHFGTVLLKDYRTPHGSVFLTSLSKTYAKHTVQSIRSLASGIFSHAVNLGHIESNPWHDVKVLGKTKEVPATKHYPLEEIENIISALVEHVDCQLIMALAFFLGLRRGEIEGLQWGDIDAGFIHIRRSAWQGHITTPKTKKSVRSIPI
ncbi:MAG TPA: site-specific integrase, partial [Candidatus Acidoferrales bacterium]|nr:site-specific integrase [Candidatus Acidoferrales bacterium]